MAAKLDTPFTCTAEQFAEAFAKLWKDAPVPRAPVAATSAADRAKPKKDEDDIDLFGDDDETEEERIREEKAQKALAAQRERNQKKEVVVGKSMIVYDVKPWDDETDLKLMEAKVREISLDGLVWGASALKPIGYGIKKLQIACVVEDEKVATDDIEERIAELEELVQSVDVVSFTCLQASNQIKEDTPAPKTAPAPAPTKPAPKPAAAAAASKDDDDIDLFADDDETEEERIREEKAQKALAAQRERNQKKEVVVGKSMIVYDVKPWDDETDLKDMEKKVRAITLDGLVWGASALKPIGYGIKKLQIACVVEDEKVATDDIEERIVELEDLVQSVDVVSFSCLQASNQIKL